MARRVTQYQANDGTLFDSMIDAEKHDLMIERQKRLEEWVEEHFFRNMFESELVADMWNDRDELVEILKD